MSTNMVSPQLLAGHSLDIEPMSMLTLRNRCVMVFESGRLLRLMQLPLGSRSKMEVVRAQAFVPAMRESSVTIPRAVSDLISAEALIRVKGGNDLFQNELFKGHVVESHNLRWLSSEPTAANEMLHTVSSRSWAYLEKFIAEINEGDNGMAAAIVGLDLDLPLDVQNYLSEGEYARLLHTPSVEVYSMINAGKIIDLAGCTEVGVELHPKWSGRCVTQKIKTAGGSFFYEVVGLRSNNKQTDWIFDSESIQACTNMRVMLEASSPQLLPEIEATGGNRSNMRRDGNTPKFYLVK